MKSKPAQKARAPSYDDLVLIADLLRSASQFSEFRLRSGDIEIEVRRSNGAAPSPAAAPVMNAAPAPAAAPVSAAVPELPAGLSVVRAPMVGTFYRAPSPDAPPFVEPGTRVAADTIVGIIEVMKLMNAIHAGCAGTVTHVLVQNAGAVEYGQPLVAIDPS